MKNFKLLLVAAVVLGAGSAFTTIKQDPGDLFVKAGNVYIPIEEAQGTGECVEATGLHCEYVENSTGGYDPAPGDLDRKWQ